MEHLDVSELLASVLLGDIDQTDTAGIAGRLMVTTRARGDLGEFRAMVLFWGSVAATCR